MPATGLGKVSMPQDTICRGRLRQVDTPLLRNLPSDFCCFSSVLQQIQTALPNDSLTNRRITVE